MHFSEPPLKVTYPQDDFIRVGLVGASIAHSKSPHLHQEWFKESGILGGYELWETQAFDGNFVENLILQGVKGVK
jgi:shikimate 5-dehydrogenase